jgi:GT2 family glycosyltransferase
MNQAEILIIGVIYNTYPETLRYLKSISEASTGNISVILADNSTMATPSDFTEQIKTFPFLQYFRTGKNLGYFGGAKAGMNLYLQEISRHPDWVLVTNVDIVFTPGFFEHLSGLKNLQNLGIIAPSIISQKWNSDYNPKIPVRNSKRRIEFYCFIYSNFIFQNLYVTMAYLKKWIRGRLRDKRVFNAGQAQKNRKIYAPHGSCLVFRKTYFSSGGTLDLPNFLFGEEIFVAETAARLGLDVIYDPELIIHDYEHASVGFIVTPRINKYYRESNKMILDKYYR